jgi:hypothetical protein
LKLYAYSNIFRPLAFSTFSETSYCKTLTLSPQLFHYGEIDRSS